MADLPSEVKLNRTKLAGEHNHILNRARIREDKSTSETYNLEQIFRQQVVKPSYDDDDESRLPGNDPFGDGFRGEQGPTEDDFVDGYYTAGIWDIWSRFKLIEGKFSDEAQVFKFEINYDDYEVYSNNELPTVLYDPLAESEADEESEEKIPEQEPEEEPERAKEPEEEHEPEEDLEKILAA